MRNTLAALSLLLIAAPLANAQVVVRPRAQGFAFSGADDKDRAMLGISTSTGGRRDTLGLMVSSVTAGSPAEKAGLEEGNRILSINGVNLKLSRDDADDDQMPAINQSRLTREMRKVKPGDEVTLEVWSGNRTRTVKVKTVSAAELNRVHTTTMATGDDNHVALGVMLNTTGSKRDTAGVFVTRVVDGSPADKAGIVEGDRIASINGVDVRVPREDAGDWSVGSSRIDRLEREVRKLKPGQVADLMVVSGGRSRSVKVTAVKASEIPGGEFSGFRFSTGMDGGARVFGPGDMMMGPNGSGTVRIMPRVRINRGVDDDDFRYELEDRLSGLRELGPQIRKQIEESFPRNFGPEVRRQIEDSFPRDFGPEIRRKIESVVPSKVTVRAVNRIVTL